MDYVRADIADYAFCSAASNAADPRVASVAAALKRERLLQLGLHGVDANAVARVMLALDIQPHHAIAKGLITPGVFKGIAWELLDSSPCDTGQQNNAPVAAAASAPVAAPAAAPTPVASTPAVQSTAAAPVATTTVGQANAEHSASSDAEFARALARQMEEEGKQAQDVNTRPHDVTRATTQPAPARATIGPSDAGASSMEAALTRAQAIPVPSMTEDEAFARALALQMEEEQKHAQNGARDVNTQPHPRARGRPRRFRPRHMAQHAGPRPRVLSDEQVAAGVAAAGIMEGGGAGVVHHAAATSRRAPALTSAEFPALEAVAARSAKVLAAQEARTMSTNVAMLRSLGLVVDVPTEECARQLLAEHGGNTGAVAAIMSAAGYTQNSAKRGRRSRRRAAQARRRLNQQRLNMM